MARKQQWEWLSGPLAHNFANTIHWRGTTPVDHIADLDGLRSWLAHEPHPLPPTPELSQDLAAPIRSLRDALRAAMIAIAHGKAPEHSDVQTINAIARTNPMTLALTPEGDCLTLEPACIETHPLIGALTHAAVTVIGDPNQRAHIAFCSAPGCGGLFHRERTNQTWCDPHCGARARAERHQQTLDR